MRKIFWNVVFIAVLCSTNTIYATDNNNESGFTRISYQSAKIMINEFPEEIRHCVYNFLLPELTEMINLNHKKAKILKTHPISNDFISSVYQKAEILKTRPVLVEFSAYKHSVISNREEMRAVIKGVTNDGTFIVYGNQKELGFKKHEPWILAGFKNKYTSLSSTDGKTHIGINDCDQDCVVRENGSKITIIDYPQDIDSTYTTAISADGSTVVGITYNKPLTLPDGSDYYFPRAFKWIDAEGLKFLSDFQSEAECVNKDGSIVGGAIVHAAEHENGPHFKAVIWINDELSIFDKVFGKHMPITRIMFTSPAGNVMAGLDWVEMNDLLRPIEQLIWLLRFSIN